MQFIINEKILSIPPYISTTWDNICSLHIERGIQGNSLVITLTNGVSIPVPNLGPDILTKVFHTHTLFISTHNKQKPQENPNKMFNIDNMIGLGFPMKIGGSIEGLGAAIQHNPEQANSPDLPKEVLDKISAVAKIMDADQSLSQSLKAEPHCNCIHCQIARAIAGEIKETNKIQEEEVTEEDLKFRTWDITQSGDQLYTVSNPLDQREHYNVFLGEPLGCTCGQKNCEHIKAVLNT